MASLNGTFDATEVAPAVPLEVLPPGKYLAQLIESEMAPTKAGDGQSYNKKDPTMVCA